MDCLLFNNLSDKKFLYKRIQPIIPEGAEGPEIPIHVLEDSSDVGLRFILSSPTKVMEANYMFLPSIGRYYYINDWTMSQGKIIITAHVDVLMSYKNFITKTSVLLDRQEQQENFNLYLPDDHLPLEEKSNVRTIEFKKSFEENTNFILILAGSNQGGS